MNGSHGRSRVLLISSAAMVSALSLVALLATTTPASAQVERSAAIQWPAAHAAPQVVPATSRLVGHISRDSNGAFPAPAATQVSNDRNNTGRFLTTAAVASVSSVLGLYAGVALGYSNGGSEDLSEAFFGGGFGSSVGAATAAGLLNGNWGRTILGSLAGLAAGTVVGVTIGEGSSSEVGLMTYGLTHGVITTLVGGW